ncbi:MAG: metallophosphoesterase [Pirellulales bacterium]
MKVAWLTDVHLNFLLAADTDRFLRRLRQAEPEAVFLTGDIAESHNVIDYLAKFDAAMPCPTYFVLGNHDFYYGSIAEVRSKVTEFCRERENLIYLTANDVIELPGRDGEPVALLGHDGWADGRIGDYEKSLVMMNDYQLIAELVKLDKRSRLEVLHRLGDEAGAEIDRKLLTALRDYQEVIVLTHVPPLREACWYDGELSDDQWAPHFTCKAAGQALLAAAGAHRDRQITVYCGHTHGRGECYPRPNLTIFTGAAEYGKPEIERVWEM